MRGRSAPAVGLLIAMVGAFSTPAAACEYTTTRDAAFEGIRSEHRLYVIARADDPEGDAIHARLKRWLAEDGRNLNVELLAVSVNDQSVDWEQVIAPGITTPPASSPVVVLTGRRQLDASSFHIAHWEPAPTDEELARLLTSPLRERILEESLESIAVVLYVPGGGADDPAARGAIDATVAAWKAKSHLPVRVVEVERNAVSDGVLLSFMDVPRDSTPWAAVVFGRGRFLPRLMGEQITAETLDQQLQQLAATCECGARIGLGIDMPVAWDPQRRDGMAVLYRETATRPASQPTSAPTTAPTTRPTLGAEMVATALWTLLALGGVVVVATLALLWLRHRIL